MNHDVMLEIEKQLLSVLGALELSKTDDSDFFLLTAMAELQGTIQGIRILQDTLPMTIGELENRQYNEAKEISNVG